MKCQKCHGPVRQVTLNVIADEPGVTVDRCTACGYDGFDRGEVDKLIAQVRALSGLVDYSSIVVPQYHGNDPFEREVHYSLFGHPHHGHTSDSSEHGHHGRHGHGHHGEGLGDFLDDLGGGEEELEPEYSGDE